MKIIHKNLLESATITSSAPQSGTATTNIIDRRLASRLDMFAGGTITIDLTSAKNIKFIGLKSNTYDVTIQANSSDSWTTPAYEKVLTSTDYNILFLDETYRYWRIVFTDASQTGYVMLSDEIVQMPEINPSVQFNYNTTSEVSLSNSGQAYGDQGYEYLDTTFEFPAITDYSRDIMGVTVSTRKEIIDMFNTVRNYTPFFCILFNQLDLYEPVWAIIAQNRLQFRYSMSSDDYSVQLSIREVF